MSRLSLRCCLLDEARKKNAIKLVDNKYFTIVVPKDPGAARLYCAGTKWCIASKNDKRNESENDWLQSFEDYVNANYEITIIINKLADPRSDPLAKVALVKYLTDEDPIEWVDAKNEATSLNSVIKSLLNVVPASEPKIRGSIIPTLLSLIRRQGFSALSV